MFKGKMLRKESVRDNVTNLWSEELNLNLMYGIFLKKKLNWKKLSSEYFDEGLMKV